MLFSFNKTKQLFLMIILGTATVWSNFLPGITVPGFGTLFPLRLLAIICAVVFLFTREKFVLYKKTTVLLFLFLLCGLASMLWCIDLNEAVTAMVIYATGVFTVFSVFLLVKDESDIVFLCRIIAVSAIIIGIMGIYESATGNFFIETKDRYSLAWVNNYLGWKYPHAIFYNTNDFATFMTAMLPVFSIAVKDLKIGYSLQYFFIFFSFFCVVLTNSRLCIVLIVVYFIWLLPKRSLRGVLVGIAAIAIAGFIIYQNWNILSNSFGDVINTSLGEESRIQIWANCLANIFRTWTFGVGVGNSVIANSQFVYFDTNGVFRAHNFFLEIFEEFGLLGVTCVSLWVIDIYKGIRKYSESEIGKYLKSSMVLSLFLSICSSSIRQAYYFWLLLALCLVYVKTQTEEEKGM